MNNNKCELCRRELNQFGRTATVQIIGDSGVFQGTPDVLASVALCPDCFDAAKDVNRRHWEILLWRFLEDLGKHAGP